MQIMRPSELKLTSKILRWTKNQKTVMTRVTAYLASDRSRMLNYQQIKTAEKGTSQGWKRSFQTKQLGKRLQFLVKIRTFKAFCTFRIITESKEKDYRLHFKYHYSKLHNQQLGDVDNRDRRHKEISNLVLIFFNPFITVEGQNYLSDFTILYLYFASCTFGFYLVSLCQSPGLKGV